MKTLTAITFALLATAASADDFTPAQAYDKASGAYDGASGALAMAGIDLTGDGFEIGIGTANISGHQALAIKGGVPIGENFRATVGAYQGSDGTSGYAVGLTFKF